MERQGKNVRLLSIYKRLCEGKTIQKNVEAVQYGTTTRTIQRDIDDIRAFLSEERVTEADTRVIVYDKKRQGYMMREEIKDEETSAE